MKFLNSLYRETFFKIAGALFFIVYILYRIDLRIREYQHHPQLFTLFAHINWSLIMLTFLLYFISYLIRKPPIARALTLTERFFPPFCASLSYLIYESPGWSHWSRIQNIPFLKNIFTPFYPFDMGHPHILSVILLIAGNTILAIGLYYLKTCFSIVIQARGLIQNGIYRYIRHPLYIGQTLTTIGSCLWIPSWFNIFLTLLFIPLQRYRAYLEEKKLTSVFPNYQEYKKKTGAYFPKMF
ncbi:MAG: isoprenylcysteine carboxylmethyltransferase family protein [Deltaproteobacteria bacterium]|nr:MAG: isoprenylcysteine carboxylmethyltransferase family protein [Deltaproteobacteria bacterium]